MRDFHGPARSSAYATEAMAATSHPLATAAAIDILKAGARRLMRPSPRLASWPLSSRT